MENSRITLSYEGAEEPTQPESEVDYQLSFQGKFCNKIVRAGGRALMELFAIEHYLQSVPKITELDLAIKIALT